MSTSDGMGIIEKFSVHDFCPILSDVHCCLSFYIAIAHVLYISTNRIQRPRLWDKDKKSEFINNVNHDHVNDLYLCINALNHQPNVTHRELNDIVDKLNNIFKNACNVTFENHEVVNNLPPTNNVSQKTWFGKECKLALKKYHITRKIFQNTKTDE